MPLAGGQCFSDPGKTRDGGQASSFLSLSLSLPSSVQASWSAGTTEIGGVVLWIDRTFLQKFQPVGEADVIHVIPGRAMICRLDGFEGSLDIITLYMSTGDATVESAAVREALARLLRTSKRLGDHHWRLELCS